MKKKIVFFDIDDTLLNRNNNAFKIPDTTKKALIRLKTKGIIVAIATGRSPKMFENIREELGIDTYVCCNGGYVVLEGKTIYQKKYDISLLNSLEDEANRNGFPMVFANKNTIWSNVQDNRYIDISMKALNIQYPRYIKNIKEDINYALIFCNKEEEGFLQKYKNTFRFIRWHPYSLDVLPKGMTKVKGIKKVLDYLNINRENSCAFGDGINDIEMIDYVGTGIAMGNAVQEVKDKSDFITKNVSEDGIMLGLKKIGLL